MVGGGALVAAAATSVLAVVVAAAAAAAAATSQRAYLSRDHEVEARAVLSLCVVPSEACPKTALPSPTPRLHHDSSCYCAALPLGGSVQRCTPESKRTKVAVGRSFGVIGA